MIGFVVIWFVCAGLGAAIASARNADALMAGLAGLLLGPLGLLVAFLIPANPVKPADLIDKK